MKVTDASCAGSASKPPPRRSGRVPIQAQLKPATEVFRAIDRMRGALSARVTRGLSPAALALAFFDWSIHFSSSANPPTRANLLHALASV